jgi:hypothetical protein
MYIYVYICADYEACNHVERELRLGYKSLSYLLGWGDRPAGQLRHESALSTD